MENVGVAKLPFRTRFATPLTPGKMETSLRKLGITGAQYRAWGGGQSLREFIALNPGWTLRQWQELVLENLEGIKG